MAPPGLHKPLLLTHTLLLLCCFLAGHLPLRHCATAACCLQPMQSYYTPYEVATHNTPSDCWVSLLGSVYDVTRLLRDNPGPLAAPILSAAGTDISHWFDASTGGVRSRVDPGTQLQVPYCPQGLFLHVPLVQPTTSADCAALETPWWRDATLKVGLLSAATRLVRVRNVLTEQEDTLEVPCEETVAQLQQRYLALNAHAGSYTWKALVKRARQGGGSGAAAAAAAASTQAATMHQQQQQQQHEWRELCMGQTLQENAVLDESSEYEALDLPSDYHVPVLHMYWNDDLTVA